MIRFYAECFDRPAFQDEFRQEGSMPAFDKAIEDTIIAINTGCLRSRDGAELDKAKGKTCLRNPDWRRSMDEVVDLLRAIRSRYNGARRLGIIQVWQGPSGLESYAITDSSIAEWMDSTRAQVVSVFAAVCQAAGVVPPVFPRPRRHPW